MKRAALLLLLVAACPGEKKVGLPEVRAALADRLSRLTAWRFDAVAGAESYEVLFRAPDRTRVVMAGRSASFDGEKFYGRDEDSKRFVVEPRPLTPQKLSLLWHQSFGEYVPEGFRAPMLPPRGVEVVVKGATVELTFHSKDGEKEVEVTSVLRWPSCDFLERRTGYGGTRGLVKMEEEQCDAVLKLCVPKKLSRWQGEQQVAVVTLSNVRLGDTPPQDAFVLQPF